MRVTELDHPLTKHLDQLSVRDQIKAIAVADSELFGSSTWGPGLNCPRLASQLEALSGKIREAWAAGGCLVLAGAGTSGRLALQVVATQPGPGCNIGLLAGGLAAFFQAREGVEDSAELGAEDLARVVPAGKPFVYLGISCGLSAAYVAGQVAWARAQKRSTVAVLGFNYLAHANPRRLPGATYSFKDLLEELVASPDGFLLAPILGAEPITGSTRMKGGTATKILLDLILLGVAPGPWLELAQRLQSLVYKQGDHLVALIEAATQALQREGSIVYLAQARAGLMAVLDASECPPTFGALPSQVRCCVAPELANYLEGVDLSGVALAGLAQLHPADFVIGLGQEAASLLPSDLTNPSQLLVWPAALETFLDQLPKPEWRPYFEDLALKWSLNLISTCAFIGIGKVAGNRMIDLRISNLKLWDRAIRIIADQAHVSDELAGAALREVLVGKPAPELLPEQGIGLAIVKPRVIPRALELLKKGEP